MQTLKHYKQHKLLRQYSNPKRFKRVRLGTWVIGVCLLSLSGLLGLVFGASGAYAAAVSDSITVTLTVTNSGTVINDDGGGGPPGSGPTQLQIINISAIPTNVSSLIKWDTNLSALSVLSWGKTPSYELGSIAESLPASSHSILISGLQSDTFYYFKIDAVDVTKPSNTAVAYATFKTLDRLRNPPPANPLNLVAKYNTTDKFIHLSWKNPPDPDLEGVRIVRGNGFFPTDPTDGIILYEGLAEKTIDVNVEGGHTYYYAAFAKDTSGKFSSGALASEYVPKIGEEPPPPVDIFEELPISSKRLENLRFIVKQGSTAQTLTDQARLRVLGTVNTIISIDYDNLPEVLKTIAITMKHPRDKSKIFSFLLRVNEDKTQYSATIAPLLDIGEYEITVYVIDYKNQQFGKVAGSLIVAPYSDTALGLWTPVKLAPLAGVIGLLAALGQITVLARVTSLYDVWLLLIRIGGAILGFLGFRERRRPWGTVYDSVTKRPIDPAYVTVHMTGKDGPWEGQGPSLPKSVADAITDLDGRYGFLLPSGTYRIEAKKSNYTFPSKLLASKNEDELYGNIYHGEPLLSSGGEIITRNIPLDPVSFDWNEFVKNKQRLYRLYSFKSKIRTIILDVFYLFGFAFTLLASIVSPSTWNFAVLAFYILIFSIQKLWKSNFPASVVRDSATQMPLSYAVVRVFMAHLSQEVKRVVTDEWGHFYLLISPGTYYITVDSREPDGSYKRVYRSQPMLLKKGVLPGDINIGGSPKHKTQNAKHWAAVFGFVLCVLSFVFTTPTYAASSAFNKLINYQGKLQNGSGTTVSDGDYNFTFRLYTASTGGLPVWQEQWTSTSTQIAVTSGLFSVLLGTNNTALASVNFNQDLYLAVEVGGTAATPVWDGEMTPRKRLGAVPAAFEADRLDGLNSSQFIRSDDSGIIASSSLATLLGLTQLGSGNVFEASSTSGALLVVTNSGNVGIGTTSPYAALSVAGSTGVVAEKFHATNTSAVSSFAGKVGIGTTSPAATRLSIASGGASEPSVEGLSTLVKFASPLGTVPWAVLQSAGDNISPTLLWFETASGTVGQIASTATSTTGQGIFTISAAANRHLGLSANNSYSSPQLIITSSSTVGIGTTSPPSSAKLTVVGLIQATNFLATNTAATSTFGFVTSQRLDSTGNATNTASQGWNITAGCFSISGTCTGGSGLTGSGAANRVAFWTAGGNLSYDDAFYWDNSTKRLAIGTTTATAKFTIATDVGSNPAFRLEDADSIIPDYTSTGFSPALSYDTIGQFQPYSGTEGGVQFNGFTESGANTSVPLLLAGYHGGTAPTVAAVSVWGFKHDGATDRTTLANSEILFDVSNGVLLKRFTILGSGFTGIGTTSPYAALSVVGSTGVVADKFHATNTSATSTFGFVTSQRLDSTGNATNTASQGWNIIAGCFSISGTCLSNYLNTLGTNWVTGTNYNAAALTPSTTLSIWSKASIYASSTIIASGNITADTFTATNTAGVSSFYQIQANSSTSLQNLTFLNATGTAATTTNFYSTTASTTNIYATNIQFATGTIGNITVTGAATSSHQSGINLTTGCFSVSGTCVGGGSATGDGGSKWATSTNDSTAIYAALAAKVGIGTTSPYAALSVVGDSGVVADKFHATNTVATSTFVGGISVGNSAAFVVNQLSTANSLYINSSGNVGIGTAVPSAKFYVSGQAWSSTGFYAPIFLDTDNLSYFIDPSSATIGGVFKNKVGLGTTTPGLTLSVVGDAFISGNITRVANIYATGTVGIGTTSPGAPLAVSGQIYSTGEVYAPFFTAASTTGTSTFAGKVGIGTTTPVGNALFVVGTSTGNLTNFIVDSNTGWVGVGTTTPAARFAVESGGTIIINGLSPIGANQKAVCVESTTGLIFRGSGTDCVVSSQRYKENVEDLDVGLSTLLNLRPVSYQYKTDRTGQRELGFIAEEVDKIEPRLVVRDDDGTIQSVKYNLITALLTKAVQELNARISPEGNLVVNEIRANKLCLGQTCIDENALKTLLQYSNTPPVIPAPPPPESIPPVVEPPVSDVPDSSPPVSEPPLVEQPPVEEPPT